MSGLYDDGAIALANTEHEQNLKRNFFFHFGGSSIQRKYHHYVLERSVYEHFSDTSLCIGNLSYSMHRNLPSGKVQG